MLRFRQWLYWLPLLIIMVVSFWIKFTALNKYEPPPGCDYGNYLTQVDILHGYDVKNWGLRYNPVFFILLDAFLRFYDEFTALKVVASLVFAVAALPFFLFAKKISGNYLAALICTWFFIFYEWYSEMIAWGGNPNFLGFSFMLLTLFFLIKVFEEPSKKNILLAGFFLSLVIGTHFLVAAVIGLTLLIFVTLKFLFSRKKGSGTPKNVVYFVFATAVFSLPYIPVYITFFTYSSSGMFKFSFLIQFVEASLAFLIALLSQYLAMTIMAVLGIFALAKYVRGKQNNGILLCSLFLAPIIFASITEQPGRWFYFLPIPVIVCFCLYLKNLFAAIKNGRKEVLALVLCFIFILGYEMGNASMNRLKLAVDYYQSIGSDEIQAFKWIRANTNTPLNATFVTSGPNKFIGWDTSPGSSYSWWIEGFAKRRSYHTGLEMWYPYTDERNETVQANKLFIGTYTFEYSNIVVSESFNSSMCNPEIGTLMDGLYQNALFMRDDKQELLLSPADNESVILHATLFQAQNKTISLYLNETWARAKCTYEWPYLKLVRSANMSLEQPSVDVIYEISPINFTLRQFNINLWTTNSTLLEGYWNHSSTITLCEKVLFSRAITTQIEIVDTDGELLNSTVLPRGVGYMPVVTYFMKPLNNSMYVHMRISLATFASDTSDQTFHFYNSYNLIKDLGIDYIFLNKYRVTEYQRFLNDSEHFTVVFENNTIVIFRVKF